MEAHSKYKYYTNKMLNKEKQYIFHKMSGENIFRVTNSRWLTKVLFLAKWGEGSNCKVKFSGRESACLDPPGRERENAYLVPQISF